MVLRVVVVLHPLLVDDLLRLGCAVLRVAAWVGEGLLTYLLAYFKDVVE